MGSDIADWHSVHCLCQRTIWLALQPLQ